MQTLQHACVIDTFDVNVVDKFSHPVDSTRRHGWLKCLHIQLLMMIWMQRVNEEIKDIWMTRTFLSSLVSAILDRHAKHCLSATVSSLLQKDGGGAQSCDVSSNTEHDKQTPLGCSMHRWHHPGCSCVG